MDHGQAGRDLLSSQLAGGSAQQEAGRAPASAGADSSVGTTRHARKTAPGDGWFTGSGARSRLPLLVVLVVQALLSVRLLGADTAFVDEAAYLWAGHLEWAHWLHGATVPPFSSYFSGTPVMYPPLGALADSAGGLAGARVLSLVFMLGATVLLWSVAGRLFGRQAGFFAAALFAVAGPTLHLGAFATYDAMSLFLLALAAWLVVSAGEQQEATGRMAAAGVVLALANATAYSSALFDPVIVALAFVIALPAGRRLAARRCGALVTVCWSHCSLRQCCSAGTATGRGSPRRRWAGRPAPPPRCACSPTRGHGRGSSSPWPSAAWSPAGSAAASRHRRGCSPSSPPPRCWGRWSRPTCTPWTR